MAVEALNDTSFKETLSDNKKVVVKFHAKWCGSCRLFAPKFKRISNEDTYTDVAFVEIDAEENQEARKAAGVDNLPFFATFQNGKLVEGKATAKEEAVRAMIENLN